MVSRSTGAALLLCAMYGLACCGCSTNRQRSIPPASAEQTEAEAAKGFAALDGRSEASSQPGWKEPGQIKPNTVLTKGLASGTFVVEIDTFRIYNDTVSLQQARSQTIAFARELALQEALPLDVSIVSLLTDMYVERDQYFDATRAKSVFMLSSQSGRFKSEQVLAEKPDFDLESQSLRYRIRYRTEVQYLPKAYNSHLYLDVKLSETYLSDGERFEVFVTPNTDGYIYLFNFYPDDSVGLIFPNQLHPDNQVEADVCWKRGIRTQIPPELEYSLETLYIVFSEMPMAGWEDFHSNIVTSDIAHTTGEESFILFQNWLGRGDPNKRVEKLAQVHVFKE